MVIKRKLFLKLLQLANKNGLEGDSLRIFEQPSRNYLSEDDGVSSCSLNSDPELERLLPSDPLFPFAIGMR